MNGKIKAVRWEYISPTLSLVERLNLFNIANVSNAIPNENTVSKRDYKQALADFKPDIVIASWIPEKDDWSNTIFATDSVQETLFIGSPTVTGSKNTWRTRHGGFEGKDLDLPTQISRADELFPGQGFSKTMKFERIVKSG